MRNEERPERADAARNRRAVLAAADALFTDAGPSDDVSMDQIAIAAGVGKGTLFRRFGDRRTLLLELYALRLEPLRSGMFAQDAPLGTDAPTNIRIPAILQATARFKLANASLMHALESQAATSLFSSPWYQEIHNLIDNLLQIEGLHDHSYVAHSLLGSVRADLLRHLSVDMKTPTPVIERQIADTFEKLMRPVPTAAQPKT